MGQKRTGVRRGWSRLSDERLLDLQLRELGLHVEGTWLEGCVDRLYAELARRGIRFRPHVWLSTEWFSPDGIPGISVPFYLAHPRLVRLERSMLLEVEGGTERACMRLLRHEAGHAIDTAFRLHYRKRWRSTFGRYSDPYPDAYRPRPDSRSYVLHLDGWYAQAHPAEDYAETFAVWLTPRSGWRQRYRDWPRALRKLEAVEELIEEHVVGGKPALRSRRRIDPVGEGRLTLREYYEKKRERYGGDWSDVYDRDLLRLFSADPQFRGNPPAGRFLRNIRREMGTAVAEWTGVHTYTIDQVLQDMIDRCRQLKLRLAHPESETRTQALLMMTVHTMHVLQSGRYEIPV